MKKLISIGIALALLTMVVVPGAVAAYDDPATYAKVPFAIIQSGLELVGQLLDILAPADLGLPTWLNSSLVDPIAEWAGGPLSWTVDMLAWGLDLGAGIVDALGTTLGIPDYVGTVLSDVACGLFKPWVSNYTGGTFDPCG